MRRRRSLSLCTPTDTEPRQAPRRHQATTRPRFVAFIGSTSAPRRAAVMEQPTRRAYRFAPEAVVGRGDLITTALPHTPVALAAFAGDASTVLGTRRRHSLGSQGVGWINGSADA